DDHGDHQRRQIVGVIDDASIDGDKLIVKGRLFDRNQPYLVDMIRSRIDQLGMSYEVSDCEVENMSASTWTLNGLKWTGAAILDKDKAAYAGTSVSLAAAAAVRR